MSTFILAHKYTMRIREVLTESYPTITMTLEQFLIEEPVKSSWIADLTYVEFDDGSGGVNMTTLGGKTYFIENVPYETYERWMRALSKGKFWWSDVKYIYTD
jgi:hypothetical protein